MKRKWKKAMKREAMMMMAIAAGSIMLNSLMDFMATEKGEKLKKKMKEKGKLLVNDMGKAVKEASEKYQTVSS